MDNPTHEWMASVERRVELLHELLRTYDLRLGIAEAKAGELQKQLTSLLNLGYEGMREQLAALAEARLDERVKSLERRCHTLASWQHAAEAADAVIRHHDLTALLWAQGYPRRSWVLG